MNEALFIFMIQKNVVVDTNVWFRALSSKSSIYKIFSCLIKGCYELQISTSILFEYEEVLTRTYGSFTGTSFSIILSGLPNVILKEPTYHWQLVQNDYDDNKFVDLAIATDAKLVSSDKHLQPSALRAQ